MRSSCNTAKINEIIEVIMKEFDITGMSCAACSARRIEKAVSTVDGVVEMVSVNLLTNSMAVDGNADNHDIINAVVNAGYGAEVKSDKPIKNTNKRCFKKMSRHRF